jgi:hypothetical protein
MDNRIKSSIFSVIFYFFKYKCIIFLFVCDIGNTVRTVVFYFDVHNYTDYRPCFGSLLFPLSALLVSPFLQTLPKATFIFGLKLTTFFLFRIWIHFCNWFTLLHAIKDFNYIFFYRTFLILVVVFYLLNLNRLIRSDGQKQLLRDTVIVCNPNLIFL